LSGVIDRARLSPPPTSNDIRTHSELVLVPGIQFVAIRKMTSGLIIKTSVTVQGADGYFVSAP
jgi:hypothetical protein